MTDTAFPHLQRATAHPPFSRRRHAPGALLHCPCCRLSLRQRHPQMTIDYCPRCIARSRQLVQLMAVPERSAGQQGPRPAAGGVSARSAGALRCNTCSPPPRAPRAR